MNGKLVQFLVHVLGETRTVVGYLWRFGFLPKVLNRSIEGNYDGVIPPCAVTNAVREFQRFNNLEPTGVLTKETRFLMAQDRCGNPDVECKSCKEAERKKRYAVRSTAWDKRKGKLTLKYHFTNYGSSLSEADTRAQIEDGMRVWTQDAPIVFKETEDSESANLQILFGTDQHGDKYGFDGQGGTLAHAFYPLSGLIHYDDDEDFIVPSTNPPSNTASLLYTTAHELGHTLGLKHSSVLESLMYPIFTEDLNRVKKIELQDDDVTGLTVLYGPGKGGVYPTGSSQPGEQQSSCHPRFSASFVDPNSEELERFLLFGEKYLVLGTRGTASGKPGSKLPMATGRTHYDIQDRFSVLEGAGPFTAGVTDKNSAKTYLFKWVLT